MYPHRIRLRGPWNAGNSTGTKSITLPSTWDALAELAKGERVRLTRNFGRPRSNDPDENVWLACSNLTQLAKVELNGVKVGKVSGQSGSFDITPHINERNELAVLFEAFGASEGTLGDYSLEIRGPVHLGGVIWTAPTRRLTVRIAGKPRQDLELYVLVHGRTVCHQGVSVGDEFTMSIPEPTEGPVSPAFPAVRLELVQGTTCWWRMDLPDESTGSLTSDSPANAGQ